MAVKPLRLFLAAFIILTFGSIVSSASGSNSGDTSSRAHIQQLEKDIVNKLSLGKNVKPLLAQIQQNKTSKRIKYTHGFRSESDGNFQNALIQFQQTLQQLVTKNEFTSNDLTTLLGQYEHLSAAAIQLSLKFDTVESDLKRFGLGDEFENRRTNAAKNFRARKDSILSLLASNIEAVNNSHQLNSLVKNKSFIRELKTNIQKALDSLKKQNRDPPVTILRASLLPFRNANLPQRSVSTASAITPSYQNTDDTNNVPVAADQEPSIDAPFSPEILTKAQSLNHDAIAIYEFVRNNVETQWYAGSQKGAVGTLRQLSGNDVDQATLLIALLRVSGIPSRYVYGVVELPIEMITTNLGIDDSNIGLNALTKAGVAFSPVVRGGKVAAVEIEYTWVSAYVPYANYRGAQVDRSGSTWIPLMPAIKRSNVAAASGILQAMNFTADGKIESYLQRQQSENILEQIRNDVTSHLQANNPDQAYEQQLRENTITTENIGLLPSTLPVTVVKVVAEQAELSNSNRQMVTIRVRSGTRDNDPVILEHQVPVSQIASERLTLSYMPATADDQNTVNRFGGMDSVPAYLVKLRPQIKLNGRTLSVAPDAVDMGIPQQLEIQLSTPAGNETIRRMVISGTYHAIGVAAQQTAQRIIENDPADTEYQVAGLLNRIAQDYNQQWNKDQDELAELMNVAVIRPYPALSIVSNVHEVTMVLGQPYSLEWKGVSLDAAFHVVEPVSTQASVSSDWMKLAALQGSILEHELFEELFLVDSISADKGLQIANENGASLVTITSANIDSVLPTLTHPVEVINDIRDWVQNGNTVLTTTDVINHNSWTGSVWQVSHPVTGAQGYFIAGGLAGGSTSEARDSWVLQWLADALAAAGELPNRDSLAADSIKVLVDTDQQKGTVGKELIHPLSVLVRDETGRPVVGAEVTFYAVDGGGTFVNEIVVDNGTGEPEIIEERTQDIAITVTNSQGIASMRYELGTDTSLNPVYLMENADDIFPTRMSVNNIEVSVLARIDFISADRPISAFAMPDIPRQLVRLNSCCVNEPFPGVDHDYVSLAVTDEHNNPISNATVKFLLTGSGSGTGSYVASLRGFCGFEECTGTDLNMTTDSRGAAAIVELGAQFATYNLEATVIDPVTQQPLIVIDPVTEQPITTLVPYETSYEVTEGPDIVASGTDYLDENGNSYVAVKKGQPFPIPVRARIQMFDKSTGTFVQAPVADVTAHVTDNLTNDFNRIYPGDQTYCQVFSDKPYCQPDENDQILLPEVTKPVDVGDGYWESSVVYKGTYTGASHVVFTFQLQQNPNIEYTCSVGALIVPCGSEVSVFAISANVLDPTINQFSILRAPVDKITLNELGNPPNPVDIEYAVIPEAFISRLTTMDLFSRVEPDTTDVWDSYLVGSTRTGPGTATITRSKDFDLEKTYHAQLVVNSGSLFEVRSDKEKIPLTQSIFQGVDKRYHIRQDVDIVNERTCSLGTPFEFTLTQDARVTFKLTNLDDTSVIETVIDNELLTKGEHSFPYTPADIPPGQYDFELIGISEVDGHEDVVKGRAASEYNINDQLPVGHTMVKGVDLFDGGLLVSETDLVVPGRGYPLEFRRTYSSKASGIPGLLGAGWTHNLNSKIIITPCAEVIIQGGDGSGQRFVDDGNNGLKPLKGHHGTLIPNHTEKTFDYYSKDGTKYHYRNFVGRIEWNLEYIQDTNGNVTKFGYDPDSVEIAKLITVEDPAGRKISLTYEDRQFSYTALREKVAVITKVTGPGDMTMEFDYDVHGNLISAKRDGEARVQTYTYNTADDVPITQKNKLLTVTNALNGVTTYTYTDEDFIYSAHDPVNGVTQELTLPFKTVSEIEEPEGGITKFNYNLSAHNTVVTDTRNYNTTYTMNRYGSPLSITDPVGTTRMTWTPDDVLMLSRTNANNVTTNYTYDQWGNVSTERVAGFTTTYTYEDFPGLYIRNRIASKTDRNNHTTAYDYDSRGNLTRMTDAENGVTRHFYAENGDRIRSIDPNGNTTLYSYDGYGNVAVVTDAEGGDTINVWNIRSLMVEQHDPEGRSTTMVYNPLGYLTTVNRPLGATTRMTYDAEGNKLTETNPRNHTTKWAYDKQGRLTSIANARQDTKTFTYDGNNNKRTESDWKGVDTTFDYDEANRLTTKTEPLGRVTTYTYDPVGNLETVTNALSRTTTNTYNDLNQLTNVLDARQGEMVLTYDGEGNKLTEQDQLGRVTRYVYDNLNRPTTVTVALGTDVEATTVIGYDANGNKTSETDPNNHTRTYGYDGLNRLIKQTDALNNSTNMTYDAVGNLTSVIDARLSQVHHEYNALNQRIKTTDPENHATEFRYDLVGNKTGETWANGNVITNVYDELDRLTSSTDTIGLIASFTYDANGNVKTETDARNNTTTHTYDNLNQLRQSDMPENRTLRFEYDLVGNKRHEYDARNKHTEFQYDELNRLERIIDPLLYTTVFSYDAVGNKLTETDKRTHTTTWTYDERNRVKTVTDPLTQVMSFTYDAVGNKLTETDKRQIVTEYSYDKENRVLQTKRDGVVLQTMEYDEVGNVKFDTDANGNITAYIYDARNLLTRESRPLAAITNYTYNEMGDRTQTRDPEGRITKSGFDLRRRLTSSTDGLTKTTNYTLDGNGNRLTMRRPNGNTWTFAYDNANRLSRVTDPLTGVTAFTYDDNGNKLTQTDAKQYRTTYTYDDLNRLETTTYVDTRTESSTYDPNGNRETFTDAKGQLFSYQYDELNRETTRTYPAPAVPTGDDMVSIVTAYDANNNPRTITENHGSAGNRVTTNRYDNFDRLIETTDGFGETIAYTYDANGNRKRLTDSDNNITHYNYDALNRLSSVTTAAGVTNYSYDRSSLQTQVSYPNGTRAITQYDAARRVSSISNQQGTTVISSYGYLYDDNGNRTQQTETNGGASEVTHYTYDFNDRLETVDYPDATVTYTYDANYNRETEVIVEKASGLTVNNKTYTYNNRNQVSGITDSADATHNATYQYDANGNQIVKSQNGITSNFIYDVRDQLVQVRQGATVLGQYGYNYQGMRVIKDGEDGLLHYTYDDSSVLLQSDASGTTVAKYEYGPDALLSLNHATEGRQYYLFDALGSVVNLTTTNGSLQSRYQYDAWGNPWSTSGSSFNDFGFTGHEKDNQTGLYYFKARFYDPATARFLNQDSYRGEMDTPPSLHRYLYAYSNPTVYIDPTGNRQQVSYKYQDENNRTQYSDVRPIEGEYSVIITDGNRRREIDPQQLEQITAVRGPTYMQRLQACSADPNCDLFSWSRAQAEQAEEEYQAYKSIATTALEVVNGPGSYVLEMRHEQIRKIRKVMGNAYKVAGVVASFNPIQAGFDVAEMAPQFIELIKENPKTAAAISTAIVTFGVCVKTKVNCRIKASKNPADELVKRYPRVKATPELANEIANVGLPRSAQTVVLIETKQGPTIVAAGKADLTDAQKALAREKGLLIADDLPEFHAEITGVVTAGYKGLTPTRGVTTNRVCKDGPDSCASQLTDMTNKSKYEFELSPDGRSFEFVPKE